MAHASDPNARFLRAVSIIFDADDSEVSSCISTEVHISEKPNASAEYQASERYRQILQKAFTDLRLINKESLAGLQTISILKEVILFRQPEIHAFFRDLDFKVPTARQFRKCLEQQRAIINNPQNRTLRLVPPQGAMMPFKAGAQQIDTLHMVLLAWQFRNEVGARRDKFHSQEDKRWWHVVSTLAGIVDAVLTIARHMSIYGIKEFNLTDPPMVVEQVSDGKWDFPKTMRAPDSKDSGFRSSASGWRGMLLNAIVNSNDPDLPRLVRRSTA
ncbi:hypothetical protein B0T16DRAFT_396026 [Cercophora newfieldiana]|uniref:Uncharacterized protein n=1 Tax=Cercophora newfieldiana TaxID=92897 RepID=A0AA39YPS3_9PEZI|nr:hypothetical protein B0T16DRAFT_396026 [Cercophora newfieldiana]